MYSPPPHLPTSPPQPPLAMGGGCSQWKSEEGKGRFENGSNGILYRRHSVSSLLLKVKHLLPLTIEHEIFINFLEFENLMPRGWTYQ